MFENNGAPSKREGIKKDPLLFAITKWQKQTRINKEKVFITIFLQIL